VLVGEWKALVELQEIASPAVPEIAGKRFCGKNKEGVLKANDHAAAQSPVASAGKRLMTSTRSSFPYTQRARW
jgi:hypothetical protein